MTPLQNKKLAAIEGKLLDVFLEEADPDKWTQIKADDPVKEQQFARGNRYWQAKVANQTMALLTRIVAYRAKSTETGGASSAVDDDKQMKADMKAAEKKVKERLGSARLSLVKKRAV
ncbi:hypothetical protein F6V25_08025 [Oryzomonas japonica]|uniref:Uncharacterized protein n=1 Tax=Oryzomonas japonica TaxID=2603858 RepID=A0A7J4ZR64_9BACT|nr:hypothetical protein [Oryzomonas japonica]KAB0665660.1 hypothetical protein F6V25_08025 [Oryzomonas japonica]